MGYDNEALGGCVGCNRIIGGILGEDRSDLGRLEAAVAQHQGHATRHIVVDQPPVDQGSSSLGQTLSRGDIRLLELRVLRPNSIRTPTCRNEAGDCGRADPGAADAGLSGEYAPRAVHPAYAAPSAQVGDPCMEIGTDLLQRNVEGHEDLSWVPCRFDLTSRPQVNDVTIRGCAEREGREWGLYVQGCLQATEGLQ